MPENFVTPGMCCLIGVCENRDLNLLLHGIGYLDRFNLNLTFHGMWKSQMK
ncbi:MAG: hypothetical protein RM368_13805 [Nostoc sp. DedSLP03]|uniref:hypothetical protein n=1 Tax=Nostoc sp. DedSLP03 TaxID=3075400 RepID=UPI002AD3ADD6|nr:hypothetical protein [Nostoc sp. DedSLP03]MDZ7966032.1 hypothetical protein [Nostoc sp. DedSLP03]